MSGSVLSTLMFALILAGLFSSLAELSLRAETSASNQGFASTVSDYENVTTHEGDLIINGTETFAISNGTFHITGSIYIQDYGRLKINNSSLVMEPHYKGDVEVSISDSGIMEVENSTLTSASYLGLIQPNIHVVSALAKLYMRNAVSDLRIWGLKGRLEIETSWVSMLCWGSSTIDLMDSTVDGEVILDYRQDKAENLYVQGLKPFQVQNVSLESGMYYLKIRNSKVGSTYPGGWTIQLYPDYKRSVMVADSELSLIYMWIKDNVEVMAIKPGYYLHWNIFDYVRGHTGYNLTLMNTSVYFRWKVFIQEADAHIYNSVVHLVLPDAEVVTVEDCHVEILDARGCKHLKFLNSIIVEPHLNGDPLWTGRFFIEFENSTLAQYFEVACTHCFLRGDIKFTDMYDEFGEAKVNFQKGTLVREYPFIVTDANASPATNASLILMLNNGTLVGKDTTDDMGRAYFNVTFDNYNYTDTLRLEAVEGNYSNTMNVGFLSDTPIVMVLRYFTDLNGDSKINILDITVVATAYNTKPGNEKWNAAADLDKNGTVNILDVTFVAKDYGKTV